LKEIRSMSQSSPLSRVKEKFGGKDKLVDQIVGLLGSTGDEPKDELRKRLLGAANRKLIRLHDVASGLKQHGGHDKLADAAAAGLGRAKDKDYVQKLTTYSAGRLLDMVRVAERHKSGAAAKAAAPAKAKAAKPAAKAKVPKAAAKKAATKSA
jgi:hypothetical protein